MALDSPVKPEKSQEVASSAEDSPGKALLDWSDLENLEMFIRVNPRIAFGLIELREDLEERLRKEGVRSTE